MVSEKNINSKIPNIHFIFPAGGKKGSFQGGFIYQLKKNYNNLFKIYQIDGTSIGALNGIDLLLSSPEIIKKHWYKIKNINDIAPLNSKNIMLTKRGNDIFSYIKSFKSFGVGQNKKLKKKIDDVINNANIDDKINKLNLFNCTVCDIEKGENIYINGTNENINQYLLASASAWILFPPVKIGISYFTDGGIEDYYPIKNLKDSKADLKVIVGLPFLNKKGTIGNNNLLYLSRLISLGCYKKNEIDYNIIKKKEKNNEIIVIRNLYEEDVDESEDASFKFDSYELRKNFEMGMKECDNFVKLYLRSNNFNNEKNIEITVPEIDEYNKKLSITNQKEKFILLLEKIIYSIQNKRKETKNNIKFNFLKKNKKF